MLKRAFEYLIFRFGLVLKIFRFLITRSFGFFKIITYNSGIFWVELGLSFTQYPNSKKKTDKTNLTIQIYSKCLNN